MGYRYNPNSSDLTIVTDVLQYSVFARDYDAGVSKGHPSRCCVRNTKKSNID